MAKVLQLYNVFGATTERTMLEVPMALAGRGYALSFAAESIHVDAPAGTTEQVEVVSRIRVEPTDDVDGQMRAIAEAPPAVRGDFDLVHGHFGPRGLHAARYLCRGIPVVISTYGYDVSRLLRDPCWAERYRWLGEHGANFVALSEAMARTLRGCGVPSERIKVVPLGIDLSRWAIASKADRRPVFLFVGRFTAKKGIDDLLNAMAILHRRDASIQLRVVGSGEAAETLSLRERVRELGIEAAVEFVGVVPYEELQDVMRRSVALIAPSRVAPDGDAEGCPMVLMQAQAVGTPVITTRHAGNAEALPPEAQRFVVAERDVQALAEAMHAMIGSSADERSALQRAGRAWIESRFALQTTVDRYDALYRRIATLFP